MLLNRIIGRVGFKLVLYSHYVFTDTFAEFIRLLPETSVRRLVACVGNRLGNGCKAYWPEIATCSRHHNYSVIVNRNW